MGIKSAEMMVEGRLKGEKIIQQPWTEMKIKGREGIIGSAVETSTVEWVRREGGRGRVYRWEGVTLQDGCTESIFGWRVR